MKISIELTADQIKSFNQWIKKLPSSGSGAIGGRIEYIIVPTSIGDVIKVRDTVSKQELDLTDYSAW
jgi:hypothetical protein